MSHDDLSSWLKVVAENKITTKNTWKSTLIDHFKDIKQFKDLQGVNFQKASCTLDGCIKVYSTRVDDVSDEAMKLLEGFNLEDTKKKGTRKKGTKTIEINLSNINIKQNNTTAFRDSTFLSLDKKAENILLLGTLDIGKDGVFRIYSSNPVREIKMCNLKIDKLNLDDKIMCPTFSKIGEVENLINDEMEHENIVNYEIDDGDFDYVEEVEEVTPCPPVFKETPFSYFQGWAGPTHWKIRNKKTERNSNSSKPREKFLLKFTEPIDKGLILLQGANLIEVSVIESRKEVNNNLPEDYNLEREDLYTYNILEGRYHTDISGEVPFDDGIQMDILPDEPNIIIDEPVDEIITELPMDEMKESFFIRREQKKVDIKKLKMNIFSNIKSSKNSKLSDICKDVPKMYEPKEKKDISIHFCIVSLLHVANEKNLELVQKDNDVYISTN